MKKIRSRVEWLRSFRKPKNFHTADKHVYTRNSLLKTHLLDH